MASRRSHVSSASDDDGARRLDWATGASGSPAVARLSSFSTAVLIHHKVCTHVWRCLRVPDRQKLIATCQEADAWCLRHIRASVTSPDHVENAESSPGSCEDVAVDCPRPVEMLAAAFGRSLAAEADATRRLLDEDDLPTCARLRLPLPPGSSAVSGPSDRHLEMVDDMASMRHQLSLMATRLDAQESLIDWLKDRDREAMEEKMRLLTMLRTQAAVLDEQTQKISALSELVSRLRNDFYGQAIDRALARSRSPPVGRSVCAPMTPQTYPGLKARLEAFEDETLEVEGLPQDTDRAPLPALDLNSTTTVDDFRLPWEVGVWGEIFGERGDVLREAPFACPEVPHDVQSEGDGAPEVKKRRTECSDWKAGAIAFKVVRRKADVSWEDQRSKEHDRAFARWLLVISRWDDCWPDLEIVKAMASIRGNEGRKDSLLDWLHPRAPATLIKRVNSILLYHKEVGWGPEVVPYREHSVYCYMRDAKAGGAKPSQLAALREALIFVRFVFDLPSLDTIVKSRRILGITRRGEADFGRVRGFH
ncbi:unnamed protein product, partial [Symbiodinium microadriaticum]